jgi:Na+-driven multidrug efflux pump
MPAWVLINAQQAVARAGGDTKMGAYADASITIVIMLPMLFALAKFTNIGPVQMYLSVKLLDVIKITIFHFWLKKERWLNNLTEIGNEQDSVNANDEVVESGIAVKSV